MSPASKPLILIVEDSRTQAAMLSLLLVQSGFDVVVSDDSTKVVGLAESEPPALIISDIVMPIMDGYGLCRAIKSHPTLFNTPVMLLTALWDAIDIVRGLQAGADYYLTKPYDGPYLVETVTEILAQPPAPADATPPSELSVEIKGRSYQIGANRRQMLGLLLSTYGNAVQQNRVLLQTQHELRTLNSQLLAQRQQIEAQQRELKEANLRLHAQATRDSLTGLRNHRALQERLHEEMERHSRSHEELSLILLDVDKFKQFNDSFGHPAGDEVLRRVATIMEEQARGSDFVARYGGEEFVILLPQTSVEASIHVAERVRCAIEGAMWDQRVITASLGIATTGHDIAEASFLIARADEALYFSKSSGRNRVTHSQQISAK